MATITYTFLRRCAGGGHTVFNVSLNGGAAVEVSYVTDEIRAPLSEMSRDEREQLALSVLKLHMVGKTRPQIVTELNAGPVTVTI